jgi:hypothetical protein
MTIWDVIKILGVIAGQLVGLYVFTISLMWVMSLPMWLYGVHFKSYTDVLEAGGCTLMFFLLMLIATGVIYAATQIFKNRLSQ